MEHWRIGELTGHPRASIALRYGLAVTLVVLALGISVVTHLLNSPPRFVSHFVLLAIAITFWCAGKGPGLVALLLSSLGVGVLAWNHFFAPNFPLVQFLIFFVIFSLLMALFSDSRRRAQKLLIEARNTLELRVAERTNELVRANEELQKTYAKLQESNSRLEEAERITHVGYWEWDLVTNRVAWSDETYRIYGLRPQQVPTDLAAVREKIHPEDWEFVSRALEEALGGGARFNIECRVLRPTGEVRILHSQGDVKRDASGRPCEMFGTTQDITDRKRAEDKIREQETELRQILDFAPQFIAVYGPNRERLYANRVFLDYVGFSLEEWRQSLGRGKHVHPDDTERIQEVFADAIARGSAGELEHRLRKRDGNYRWVLARFNPLRNEQGQVTRWYVTATDIDDRKQAEERLRSENVALREEIDKTSMFEEIVGFTHDDRPLDDVLQFANVSGPRV